MKFLLFVFAFVVTGLAQASVADRQAVNIAVAEQQIVPSYRRFRDRSAAFADTVHQACADPAKADVDAVRKAYPALLDAWMGAEIWRFGPVDYRLRRNRIWYWPDKHGRAGKHVRRLLGKADLAALKAERFAAASVALQGLPALERVAFVKDAAGKIAAEPFRCAYLNAVAGNVAAIGRELARDWDESLALIRGSDRGNEEYEDGPPQVTALLLQSLYTGLSSIESLKLGLPLGKGPNKARGKRGESWRLNRGLDNIRVNLDALERLYGISGDIGLGTLLAETGKDQALDAKIRAGFALIRKRMDSIRTPLHQAVAEPRMRPSVEALRKSVKDLAELIGKEFPGAIGTPLGFNSLDGD